MGEDRFGVATGYRWWLVGDQEAVVGRTVDHVEDLVTVEVGPQFTAGDAVRGAARPGAAPARAR
jgi:hypothetical protein